MIVWVKVPFQTKLKD